MKKFLIIGFGNMGQAFYKGMLRTVSPEDIFVCDKHEDNLLNISEDRKTRDLNKFIDEVDTVVFAVKPQSFVETINKINTHLSDKTIVSMMAGKPFNELEDITESKNIIRIMPNLAVEYGKGVTLWKVKGDRFNIAEILGNMGVEVEMDTEEQFNNLTPITGSGQAFYFLLSELFEKKALSLGISKEKSNELVRMVFDGCNEMLSKKNDNFEVLRSNVTSKGGMTEASINHLIENGLWNMVSEAVDKGAERGKKIC
jgi:pyrroline-5-carboxylate reductase